MSWYGNRIRHSLAARGIRIKKKPLLQMDDVRGLERLVGENSVPDVKDFDYFSYFILIRTEKE